MGLKTRFLVEIDLNCILKDAFIYVTEGKMIVRCGGSDGGFPTKSLKFPRLKPILSRCYFFPLLFLHFLYSIYGWHEDHHSVLFFCKKQSENCFVFTIVVIVTDYFRLRWIFPPYNSLLNSWMFSFQVFAVVFCCLFWGWLYDFIKMKSEQRLVIDHQ